MRIVHGLKKLFHVNPSAFGCDITDHSIRVAELKRVGSTLTLKSFGFHVLPEGTVVNGELRDAPGLAQHLRQALTELKGEKLRTPYVIASLPDPQCFLRIVQLPKLSSEEVPQALMAEIEANIPLALSDVYYAWDIANPATDKDHLDIMVAAAPKALVDQYVSAFVEAGFKPMAFEIDALATVRSVISQQAAGESRPLLLIDIAYNRATFLIYANGMVRFTASVPHNAKADSDVNTKVFAQTLALQARSYMDFFATHATHTHLPFADVRRAVICGDDFYGSDLAAVLTVALGIPVELANPWVNILTPPLREVPLLPYKESLGYTAALGLALRAHQEFST